MRAFNIYKIALIFILVSGLALNAVAQYTIIGPTTVTGNQQYTYQILPTAPDPSTWAVGGSGTINSQNLGSATVTWNCTSTTSTIYVTDSAGTTIASLNVTINANPTLVGGTISNPSQTIGSGTAPATINCSAATGGSCSVGSYTYTWQRSTDNISWTDIAGSNVQNYLSGTLTATTYFRRKVVRGATAYSTVATVTVNSALVAGSISPSSQSTNQNTAPGTQLTLSGVSGGNGTYTYQWQSSPNGTGSWTNVGTNVLTYSPPVLTATTYYRVKVSSNGSDAYTANAVVNVYPPLTVGGISPASVTINSGASPGVLACATPTGGSGTYSYQWQVSTDNTAYANVTALDGSGGSTQNFTPAALTQARYYRVIVTSSGLNANSGIAQVLIGNGIGVQPATNMVGSDDFNRNWILTKGYDADGNVIGESKQFFDDNGRPTQLQTRVKYRKDATTVYTHVFASQVVRDALGRDAMTTLAAPIDNSAFKYEPNFVRNPSGTVYNHANFDLYTNGATNTDKTNAPDAIGSKTVKGTLGWYYSTNNTWEPYMPTTDYPFNRQTYYNDGTNNIKKSAGAGESFKMGSGHEVSSIITAVDKELNHYLTVRNKYFPATVSGGVPTTLANEAIQTMGMDANGKEAITIQDKSGKTLMVARPGSELSVANSISIGGSTDPDKNIYYFKLFAAQTVTLSGTGTYALYNMNTEQAVSGTSLAAGYYKLVNTDVVAKGLSYTNSYSDVSYSFYNQLGQLIATIAPEGVKKLYGTGINSYATKTDVPFITLYEYDTQGRLIATQNAETGRTEYVYRQDGKIRFSQNAEQRAGARYSYTNYDKYGRSTEAGEFTPNISGGGVSFNKDLTIAVNPMRDILESISPGGGIGAGLKTDIVQAIYDIPASSGVAGYIQDGFTLRNAVSATRKYSSSSATNGVHSSSNITASTEYNYDEEGKLLWEIRYIKGLGYKTIDYEYDNNNLLVKRIYQKTTAAEYFEHQYDYDPTTLKLRKVSTKTSAGGAQTLQASYVYYLDGTLKRTELATDLQGIDYTYTLQGALKAINNNDKTKDPGQDGIGGIYAAFKPDAFGMVLDYHANDYLNTRSGIQIIKGVNTGALTTDYFNGQIKAVSWFSKKPTSPAGLSDAPLTYVYQYDDKYQLTEASWGNALNFSNTPATFTTTSFYKEKIKHPTSGVPGYDANGNITYLERTNKTGTVTEKFQYNYTTNTNKLASITNTASGTQTYASYTYDALGQLTYENTLLAAQKKYIKYDVTGKVILVARDAAFTQPVVAFEYNELGQRTLKKIYNSSYQLIQNTYYLGDVIYTQTMGTTPGPVIVQEYEIDGGGGRLGIYYRPTDIYAYQLTDHLGNTRAVVAKSGTNLQIRMYSDYYPYGMAINEGVADSRYGYQGQYAEKDPETEWNAFELRMYDSKIGRWLNADPKNQFYSPYVGMGNNPINAVDPDGGKTEDWYAYKNDNGKISMFYDANEHGEFIDYHGQIFYNVGSNLVNEDVATANALNLFSYQSQFKTTYFETPQFTAAIIAKGGIVAEGRGLYGLDVGPEVDLVGWRDETKRSGGLNWDDSGKTPYKTTSASFGASLLIGYKYTEQNNIVLERNDNIQTYHYEQVVKKEFSFPFGKVVKEENTFTGVRSTKLVATYGYKFAILLGFDVAVDWVLYNSTYTPNNFSPR